MTSSNIMINIYVFIFLVFLTSCASNEVDDQTDHLREVFAKQGFCRDRVNDLLNEWERNGGGVKVSLKETRNQIKSDDKSRIALIIKDAWNKQKQTDIEVEESNLGEWPIPDEKYRQVVMSTQESKVIKKEKLEDCPFIIYFTSLILDRYILNVKQREHYVKFDEVPNNMMWESPHAQVWVTYWLFANLAK